MNKVIFKVEVITPLFMAGADQATAEIRAPSFRGEMRYWYRAMVRGLLIAENASLTKLREAEGDLFGITDKGSTIQLRILDAPTKTRPLYKSGTGKDYLFWSVMMQRRQCFLPNTRFKVVLSVRGNDEEEKKALSRAVSAFWLLSHLGGIGSRSRRCAGSLMVKPLQPLTGDVATLPFKEATSVDELKTLLEDGIKVVRSLFPNLNRQPVQSSAFDVLSSETCKIWIIRNQEIWKDSDDAMESIGESLQMYRKQFSEIKAHKLLGNDIPLDRRGFNKLKALEIFGLPLGKNASRQASPLLLRITKLQREYVCIAVLFKTTVDGILPRNYTIIEDWISTFPVKERIIL